MLRKNPNLYQFLDHLVTEIVYTNQIIELHQTTGKSAKKRDQKYIDRDHNMIDLLSRSSGMRISDLLNRIGHVLDFTTVKRSKKSCDENKENDLPPAATDSVLETVHHPDQSSQPLPKKGKRPVCSKVLQPHTSSNNETNQVQLSDHCEPSTSASIIRNIKKEARLRSYRKFRS